MNSSCFSFDYTVRFICGYSSRRLCRKESQPRLSRLPDEIIGPKTELKYHTVYRTDSGVSPIFDTPLSHPSRC